MKIGFTNGCFDLLHEGHLHLLEHARMQCDHLILAIDHDSRVHSLKCTGRPVDPLWRRISNLQTRASAYVDAIVPFHDATGLLELIHAIKPAKMFKGDDYVGQHVTGADSLPVWNGELVFIPRLPGISTTILIAGKNEKGKSSLS
jgi:D-beta-D-heptose 7-phosphate kinase/D-beta-D-heptose 1-phosphate adenosyltransferase